MRCPFCGHLEDKVVDSRQSRDGNSIRRRRECLSCQRRFTSYEHIEEVFPQIVKKDGTREDYDRQKIEKGLRIACNKLPISRDRIEEVVDAVESRLLDLSHREVSSEIIGSLITEQLRHVDPVAYIRFASVYREFADIQEFLNELRDLDEQTSQPVEASESEDE